ncbi:MAG: mechanosensitive ion channel family protein [Candidatus Methanomethyliaceae archaeon]|nr:mechanosensitive ion channel family protein [Candidatus Methanomethyliaceae archaeon]MDW7971149.1 mechanosensitive ion channel [Nitrososphaerota archaeon]
MIEQGAARITKNVFPLLKVIFYITTYIIIAALIQWIFKGLLANMQEYLVYAQILLSLGFGYLIVDSIAAFFYQLIRIKYNHPTAAAIKNIIKIIGIGGMVAAIAGGVAGGAAGVALGGFMGLVIGFASQQILGQAISGLFLLIARPFKIGDKCILAGEEGIVEDVSILFTKITKMDGSKVFIPNNSIVGSKIILKQ